MGRRDVVSVTPTSAIREPQAPDTSSAAYRTTVAPLARRVNRLLAAMAYSRRFEELAAEARHRNRHNLYRTARTPPE
jgi:hypothetical protein